jgi:hypothetical protein
MGIVKAKIKIKIKQAKEQRRLQTACYARTTNLPPRFHTYPAGVPGLRGVRA